MSLSTTSNFTQFEKQFLGLYKAIDKLSLGKTGLVAKKNKYGAIQITDAFFSTTKIFMWDKAFGARQNQEVLSPTYLWDKFHYINNPEIYQYIITRAMSYSRSFSRWGDRNGMALVSGARLTAMPK